MTQLHALIVDDNANNVSVLAQLLADEGVSCTQVTNPKQLDTILASMEKVDIVFLDIELPGINGYEILRTLKLDKQHFVSVPIVAYTVHTSEMNRAYQLGFDSFIGKPLDPDLFPGQLAQILRGEQVWSAV